MTEINYSDHLDRRGLSISEPQLAALAAFVGNSSLPLSYIRFLQYANGSQPVRPILTFESTRGHENAVVNSFFATDRGAYSTMSQTNNLWEQIRLPRTALAVGDDANGNFLIMSLEPETHGQMLFWDHEMGHDHEPDDTLSDYTDQTTTIADNIEDLVSGLSPDTD